MFDKISQSGLFWIEKYKEKNFQGEIQFDKDNFIFKIINMNFEYIHENKILINGIIENKPINFILINSPIASKYESYGINIKSYYISDVFLGVNYNTKEEREFKKIMFKINNISSVLNLHSLENNSLDTSPLEIKPCEPITIPMDNFTIKIEININKNWKNRGNGRKITFEEYVSTVIEYNESQKIGTIYKSITRIERLFTLLTGKSEITELKGINEDQIIEIINPSLLKKFSTRYKVDSIKLNEIEVKKVFENWLTNYDNMVSVYDLFYSINEEVEPSTLFVTYSRIIENYHRQGYPGKYLTPKEFKSIHEKITGYINSLGIEKLYNEEFKQKIISSVNFTNEYSFQDRLIEIFRDLENYNLFREILKIHVTKENIDESIKEFARLIKENRNYYIHNDDKTHYKRLLSEKKLLELNDSLNMIIKLIFLKELKFKTDEIDNYTNKNRQFKFKKYINLEI